MPPLIGGMEVHAKYFIEYFSNRKEFSLAGVVTKINNQNYVILSTGEKSLINLNKFKENFQPKIIFFNSGKWIEELEEMRTIFYCAKFIYRTGGNEILKAPLAYHYDPDHKIRQSYWVRTINKNIDVLITNSAFTEKRLKDLGVNIIFKRFVGGVNISNFKKIKPRKNKVVTIFCAARFVPYKNHSLMVSVISELAGLGLKFRVRLAGGGPLFDKIKTQVQNLNLNSVIKFLGELDNHQTCEEIINSNIYMQFSSDYLTEVEGGSYIHAEGMGRSMLEALSAGVFIIGGRSGALPEIIKKPYGLLVDTNNSAKFIAKRIAHIIQTPPMKRKITNKYSWPKIFTAYQTLFQNILSGD